MLGTVAWSLAETRAAGQPLSPGAYAHGPWGELGTQELDTQQIAQTQNGLDM